MDRSAVKAIVDANIRRLRWETQTQDWDVKVEYTRCEDGEATAWVVRNLPYRQAVITIDPEKAHDEAGVLNSLRHELLHVALAPFDAYLKAAQNFLADDAAALRVLDGVWVFAVETAVGNLERLMDRVGEPCPFGSTGEAPAAPGVIELPSLDAAPEVTP